MFPSILYFVDLPKEFCKVVTKNATMLPDSEGRLHVKSNMDLELAVDVMSMSDHVEHIVIFGNSDYGRLIDLVQQKAVRISIVSTMHSSPPMLSEQLRDQADNFIELLDLKPHIVRDDDPAPEQPTKD